MFKIVVYAVLFFISPALGKLTGLILQQITMRLIGFNKSALAFYFIFLNVIMAISSLWLSVLIFRLIFGELPIMLFWIISASLLLFEIIRKRQGKYQNLRTSAMIGTVIGILCGYGILFSSI